MSEIIKFVLDNFAGLRALDYLLLLFITSLAAGTAVTFFRWLFRARFEAQRELLEIRAATIETVKQQLASIKQDYKDLQDEADSRAERLKRAFAENASLQTGHKATAEMAAKALVFASNVQFALLASSAHLIYFERLALTYRQFHLYTLWRVADRVRGAPTYADIDARLEQITDSLAATSSLFEPLHQEYMSINRSMNVVEATQRIDTKAIDIELTALRNAMTEALTRFARELESSSSGSP